MAEASTPAIINTACTKAVAIENWFQNYTLHLTVEARKERITYPFNLT